MADGIRLPPYTYWHLGQACSLGNGMYNLYAVVAEFSIPRRSRGSDYVCNLVLIDPLMEGMQRPVDMLVFAPSDVQLPRVHKPGDIIRLHRVKVQTYNDKPQFVGKVAGRGGPPFAFCLFDSDPASGNVPYQASSAHYHWDEQEAGLLAALRQTVAASNAYQLAPRSEYLRTIKDIRVEQRVFIDLVCKVLAYDVVEEPGWGVMFVWDSTDALPFPYMLDTRQFGEENGSMAPDLKKVILRLPPLALPLKGPEASQLPVLGTALPVVLQGGSSLLGSSQPAVGSWVKLRNIGVRVVQGQLQAYYTRGSKWSPWQPQEEAELSYQHRLHRNEVAGWAPTACAELLAVSQHDERPFTSLRQVLLDTPLGRPRKYRVLARVVDFAPSDPSQMCHPAEDCGMAGPSGICGQRSRQWVYTLKLLLEDATGQLDAVLFGKDAARFFGPSLPAGDLGADPEAAGRVLDVLQCLLGKESQRDGGPWVDICLKAFYCQGIQDPWEATEYVICDTMVYRPEGRDEAQAQRQA